MMTNIACRVVSLLEAIIYKEHPYRKHQFCNIVSDTPYTGVTGMMLHIKSKKNHIWKIEIKSHRVSLVERELLTILEHLSLPMCYSRVRIAQSLVFCVVFTEFSHVLQ
jgi:hypothetical protein